MEIGQKIKRLRVLKGLTQEELADRAELSKGFISQVERDLTSPSIATLVDILQCLGTTISEFFNDNLEEQIVFGKEDFFQKVDAAQGSTVEWIVPNAQKNQMEPIILTLHPRKKSQVMSAYQGQEFGYVLKGSVTIVQGGKKYRVKAKETFYLDGTTSHYLYNHGSSDARVLWITTPPMF